jgi:hypothetical protein
MISHSRVSPRVVGVRTDFNPDPDLAFLLNPDPIRIHNRKIEKIYSKVRYIFPFIVIPLDPDPHSI